MSAVARDCVAFIGADAAASVGRFSPGALHRILARFQSVPKMTPDSGVRSLNFMTASRGTEQWHHER